MLGVALMVCGSLVALLALLVPGERVGPLKGIATVMLVTGITMCLLPGIVGAIVALMLGMATTIAIYQRGVSERAALNEAIALGLHRGVPLDRLAFAFALGRRDRLGERAYRFAQYIQAGFAADQAAVTAGLKLTPNLHSSLARLSLASRPAKGSSDWNSTATFAADLADEQDQSASAVWLVGAFYLVILMGLGTIAVSIFIAPMMLTMLNEFEMDLPPWLAAVVSAIEFLPLLGFVLFLAFGGITLLGWLMYAGILSGGHWLPVLGPYFRDRYDAQALQWLAAAIAAGQSLDLLEQELRRARVGPSGARLWRALKWVREGVDWPQALRRASLLSGHALPWVAVAHGGDHLARALVEAAAARRRHAADRLRMGLRIAGPIGLLIGSIPIWLCGLLLIGILAHLVQELA